jgi:hypothetical protein
MSARCRDAALRARDGRVRGANRVRRIDRPTVSKFRDVRDEKSKQRKKQRHSRAIFSQKSRDIARERTGEQSPKTAEGKNRALEEREKHPQIAETIDERARDAPVYVARTATARARLRRETREGARKPAGRVVGWIFGKSRVSEAERRGGERNDAA